MAAAADPGQDVVLETDRLLLRRWRMTDAGVQRELWTERDPREASWAVLAWARSSGYERLWSTVRHWNTASRRVLAKIGFTGTGRAEVDPVGGSTLLFLTKRL